LDLAGDAGEDWLSPALDGVLGEPLAAAEIAEVPAPGETNDALAFSGELKFE
jgi:hypothetical protein